MYLKSIEVQGFKSFANKIVFDFHNGITGIVGPNGSGKSNVADAVRWVLGEQSAKQLRGAKMEDVIFAGTQNRKPVGFAYVAITLDNSDHALPVEYDEVTVSRRVYRSGESEYKINGHTCRLKDVTEMFYDTGIGKEGEEVNEVIDDKYLVKEANEHFAEVFYGTFMADYTDGEDGFSVTVHQAQQNYPKAVKSCREGVAVMLVPENVGEITMQSGMAKEQQFMIHFHSPAMKLWEIDNRSLIYQMPDRPYIEPEVFKRAGVMIDVFPVKYNDDFEISLMAKADGHSRCYGMLNWGDTVDQGYTVQGRGGGKPVWSNNEYDYPHACALMYARTGVRRFMDYLIVSAKHWMDIDVCHYSSNPLRIGGQWEHTAGHCKNGVMVCSHEWVEGLLDYYHFTGDKRGYDTAIGIGENVLKLLETPMYQVPGEANARETGWALRTLTALYVETNDNKWLVKCDWIIDNFKKWEEEYGDWLSPYTDNTAIRVGFMISIAVGSVMRYYRIFPREDIRQMILRAVDDLTENCYMDNGLFYYKELPSLARNGNNTLLLEALAIAYELTGNKQYLEYGINTFRGAVNEVPKGAVGVKTIIDDAVICQGNSGKGFAQSFIPLATYYNAISENNMTF